MSGSTRRPGRIFGVVLSLGLVALLGALARVPLAGADADRAALRLTWRLRGEEATVCQRPTEAELENLPIHMRNPDACVGDLPPFQLEVHIDGEPRVSRLVHPAGVRGDRPIFVYDELMLEPGRHRVVVTFELQDPTDARISLGVDTTVVLDPGQVLLVTRAQDGSLEVREPIG